MNSNPLAEPSNGPAPHRPGLRPDLLSRDQAAAYIGVSRTWLAHRTPDKGGPAWLKVGARVYYRQADLDHYLDEIVREDTCRSTVAATPARGGTDSRSAASSTALPPALGIAEKLRRQSVELAQRSKQTSSPARAAV